MAQGSANNNAGFGLTLIDVLGRAEWHQKQMKERRGCMDSHKSFCKSILRLSDKKVYNVEC